MKSLLESLACFVVLLVLVCGGMGAWYGHATGAFLRSSDVHLADPLAAVSNARQLIESFRKSAAEGEDSQFLRAEQLPECLRIPKLRHAYVFRDHMNLVIGRNPGREIGARVWALDATTAHTDEVTLYRDIFFYQYSNDTPASPKDRR